MLTEELLTLPFAARPKILVTPRYDVTGIDPRTQEQYAPNQALATVFSDALVAAGAQVWMMPLTEDEAYIDYLVSQADGIAVPGGQDVSPQLWGDTNPYDESLLCHPRDAFESAVIRRALDHNIPVFATCRGMQLLNVVCGGTLCMDVPSRIPREGRVLWKHTGVLRTPMHPVEVIPESLLARVVGTGELLQTNSSHHCCVETLGEGVQVTAEATDGIPEAIEVAGQNFCMGVQWHPEYTWQYIESDRRLWQAFVCAAAEYKAQRSL